jgi:hypothetical protein
MIENTTQTVGIIVANVSTVVAAVGFILNRINKVDESNGKRVAAVHARLDSLMERVMPREDVMTHIDRLDRQVERVRNGAK